MENWPDSSLVKWLLLENPWPAVGVMSAAAVVLGWMAWRKRNRTMGIVAVLIGGTAGAMIPVAGAIVTPRELLLQLTGELVAAGVPPVEADVLEQLFTEDVVLEVPANTPVKSGWQSVIDLARKAEQAYSVQSWNIGYANAVQLSADHGQSFVIVSIRLVSRGTDILAGFELGIPTEWLIDWRLTAEGWRADRIVLRKIAGQQAGASQLP